MGRNDWILIGALVVLLVMTQAAISTLTILGAPEWIKFVIMMGMLVTSAVGTFWFVILGR